MNQSQPMTRLEVVDIETLEVKKAIYLAGHNAQEIQAMSDSLLRNLNTFQFFVRSTPSAGSVAAVVVSASPWVSITDRLPELRATVGLLDESIWMNTASDDHSVNWHGVGYLCENGQKYWHVFGEARAICLDAVTHWMPLPVAPQLALDAAKGA